MCAENTGNIAFEAICRELYQLRPSEFTETRNRRAAESRAQGDQALADSIRGLRRPSNPAWAVNLLATAEQQDLESLLGIGDELRSAQRQSLGARLRELSKRRAELLARLTESALVLASRSGYSLGDQARQQIERTLNAAVSDPAAASAVRAGTLVKPLTYSGFGQETEQPPAPPSTAEVRPPTGAGRRRADLDAARRALERATEELRQADQRLRDIEERRHRIERRRRELRDELHDADTELQETDTALTDTRHRRAEAQRQRSSLRQRVQRLERKQTHS